MARRPAAKDTKTAAPETGTPDSAAKQTPAPDGKDPLTGRFVQGNRFWTARSSHGAKPDFAGPDVLSAACFEYFEWVEANPLYATELVKFQGEATLAQIPKMRAMTLNGLCNFLDISFSSWQNYRLRSDFLPVCTQVEDIIRQQKFEGASADMLNAAIIARDLGLADKREHSGPDGEPMVMIYKLPDNGR